MGWEWIGLVGGKWRAWGRADGFGKNGKMGVQMAKRYDGLLTSMI